MAKAKRATKLRNAAGKKSAASVASKPAEAQGPLSRGQRKRATKRTSLVRKRALVSATVEHRKAEAAKGLGSMGGLMETLAGAGGDAQGAPPRTRPGGGKRARAAPPPLRSAPAPHVVSNRGRKAVAERESVQLAAVLANEAFKRDPFAAIQAHLRVTMPEAGAAGAGAAAAAAVARAGSKAGGKGAGGARLRKKK